VAKASWWRWAQAGLGLVVAILAVRSLAHQWSAFREQQMHWQPQPGWLLLAVVIVWGSYGVLIEGWRRVVLSMGEFLTWRQAAKVTMVSNLGKYLPGKVWAIAGAAMLAEREGVKPAAAVASAFILQALSLASGLALIAALAPEALQSLPDGASTALTVIAVLAIGGLLVFVVPGGLGLVRPWLPGPLKTLQSVAPVPLLLGLLANVAGWAAYGVSFMLLTRGLLPDLAVTWATATAVFTASYIIGLVAAFAPGGIGPREAAFVLLLSPAVGAKAAVALAIASRLLLTITELGAALPFIGTLRRTSRTS
jgi:uncharacterized membrane protein YbhN (UPF0104 family)